MILFAHAGKEHVTTSESALHIAKSNFVAFFIITAVFISIILLLAYISRPKKSLKPKEESHE